ncbi:signal transduction histidine kinase/ActR/RegA family two-component response regulator [Aequitasia blattaphilus]|uniref:Stage 0 sporulation protein A homolog n=1 Tax=Aequitasia blattaphilus TaxID=2949332 RepID=A0ABT1EC75_9FIRM|nr:ATP-binding protein [Aequitasia blattaphilus]MCP1103438.1 ATP-binding protein [Aequitasia blattaphilus]MCR8616078.1 ATP-binding protein [Aequitasia blattaphilus]
MLQILCGFAVLASSILMAYTTYKFNTIFKKIDEYLIDNHPYLKRNRTIVFVMLIFFVIGYIISGVDILVGAAEPFLYFVSTVFILGSFFVFFMMQYMEHMTNSLKEQGDKILEQNKNLQSDVEKQVEEVLRHDQMLRASNEMASRLLASRVEDFDLVLHECMGLLAKSVDADRMYIWQNHVKNEKLHCTQIIEWSEEVEPQQNKDLAVDIPYDENIPGWEEAFKQGKSINGLVRNLSQAEQDQLSPQGILSILVVPVYYKGEFWGFIGFDDCHSEREFAEAQEGILRAAGLLIATALLRNEMTVELIRVQDAALEGTKAKSNFLATMSHEIRTPINAITGMVAIAQDTKEINQVHNYLDKIDAVTRQLLGVINDILDMSKIEAGKMELVCELFDSCEMLDNIKNIIGVRTGEKKQTLNVTIDDDVPRYVEGDELRLTQIMLNLLSNATKFTPENGKIEVRVSCIDRAEEWVNLQIVVTDNGIGIPKEQQGNIFKSFEQAEKSTARIYGGTGLGLVISKHIAKMMNGDITLVSEPGRGSQFTVIVQLKKGDSPKENKANRLVESIDLNLKGKTVLLAEDIKINQEIIVTLLSRKGAAVHCGENGKEALSMFRKNALTYDIILMDIQMPVMDGYEATREIRNSDTANAETIPIIAMTANAFAEDVQKCLEAGMNGHIPKPIDINVLYQTIHQHLYQ